MHDWIDDRVYFGEVWARRIHHSPVRLRGGARRIHRFAGPPTGGAW